MYYPNAIEDSCYEQSHIDLVLAEINSNIPNYLEMYIETDAGNSVLDNKLEELKVRFGSTAKAKKRKLNKSEILKRLIREAVHDFQSDRESYQEHLDLEALEEYREDVNSFKNTILKNQIPIIRKTLQNKAAKELDKYRNAFREAQPTDLFTVIDNIIQLAEKWRKEWYDARSFEQIRSLNDLGYHDLDKEGYTAYGVIGGGIKSHFIYKLYPEMFPNRSREAVWALWYLSDKRKFGCKEDSQFLMINSKEGTTQQNYFYPYALFAYYALEIYHTLKDCYTQLGISIAENQRFIVVDSFLSFVSRQHQKEIDVLKQKSKGHPHDH